MVGKTKKPPDVKKELQLLVKKHQSKIHNPNIPGSETTLEISTSKHVVKDTCYKGEEIILNFNAEQKHLMLCWLDATTKMYNETIQYVKTILHNKRKWKRKYEENPCLYTLAKYNQFKQLYYESQKWRHVRTNVLKPEKENIKLRSTLKYNESGNDNPKSKRNINTHSLDAAIKQCCASYVTMIKNKQSGHIKKYTLRNLKFSRTNRIIEFESSFLNNFNSWFHKSLGKFVALKDGKTYDMRNIHNDSKIKYNSTNDRFTLHVPTNHETEKDLVKPFKIISIDPGVRDPLNMLTDDQTEKYGKHIIEKINKEYDKVKEFQERNLPNKVIKRRRKICKYRVKNAVTDFHWEVANYLSKNVETIVFGDINVKSIISKENTKISDETKRTLIKLRLRGLIEKLKYKCSTRNTALILVNESFTTKICSMCGYCKEDLGGNHVYNCNKCHVSMDRDYNSCRNILLKATVVRNRTFES